MKTDELGEKNKEKTRWSFPKTNPHCTYMETYENGSHTTFVASARSRKRCRGELYLSQNKF